MHSPSYLNPQQLETWLTILGRIEQATVIASAAQAYGCTEGYALGLYSAGVITAEQRDELVFVAMGTQAEKLNALEAADE